MCMALHPLFSKTMQNRQLDNSQRWCMGVWEVLIRGTMPRACKKCNSALIVQERHSLGWWGPVFQCSPKSLAVGKRWREMERESERMREKKWKGGRDPSPSTVRREWQWDLGLWLERGVTKRWPLPSPHPGGLSSCHTKLFHKPLSLPRPCQSGGYYTRDKCFQFGVIFLPLRAQWQGCVNGRWCPKIRLGGEVRLAPSSQCICHTALWTPPSPPLIFHRLRCSGLKVTAPLHHGLLKVIFILISYRNLTASIIIWVSYE